MRVVLCYPLGPTHLATIQACGPNLEVIDAGQEHIAEELLTAEIYCGHAKVPVPWDAVVAAGRLRWIQSSAAGMDHCLVPAVVQSTIPVTSAAGLFAPQVAEHTLALLLGILRRIPEFLRDASTKRFVRQPTDDLRGKAVGIVGFGGNGRRIAEVLRTFAARTVAFELLWKDAPPTADVEAIYPVERLDEFLSHLDVVILCVPLTGITRGMFDAQRIARMKPGSILINVARGEVVVESALVTALRDGPLFAAGLDVTEVEPLPDSSPLWNLLNVVITPHVGAQAFDRLDRTTEFFCENLRRFLTGRPLRNLVDKQRGF